MSMKSNQYQRYTESQRNWAKDAYISGEIIDDIAKSIGCTDKTIRNWRNKEKWDNQLQENRLIHSQIKAQIKKLAATKVMTEAKAKRLAMLTNSLTRLQKLSPTASPIKATKTKVRTKKSREILERFVSDDYGLYSYQKDFLMSSSRFMKILKARQIGYSYGCLAPRAILNAIEGRDQLIISASEDQAKQVLNYILIHLERLGIEPNKASDKTVTIGKAVITALPNNFRTIQGRPGDVILDEFAWYQKPKRIWDALVPSITACGGSLVVCSTPFVPGNMFWELMTEYKGKYSNFESSSVNIHQAIEMGMPLPGGLDELRSLFDSDSWAMLYECQWADDGSALLSWDLLNEIATSSKTSHWDGQVYIGVDVGRKNDRFAIAIVGEPEKNHFRLLKLELYKNINFADQRQHLENIFNNFHVKRMIIDQTGIGMQLAEEIMTAHSDVTEGRWFTRKSKERMALGLLKLSEDKNLSIYNDSLLLAQLHAVKKKATATGITYDAERDSSGHGDGFWALALAVENLSRQITHGGEIEVEVW